MAKDMKETWKETGTSLGHAFRDLGKALVKTGKVAVNKVDEWANREENQSEEKPQEPVEEKAETPEEK